ncbi:MAG: sulfurtransferase [Chloroflexi bacterium]|nr:sulfurtransferase [Chloroflexota bacterium]
MHNPWKPDLRRSLIVLATIAVVALALVAGCSPSPASPAAAPSPTKTVAQPTTVPTSTANTEVLVETDWLAQKLADPTIRIIDARSANDFKAGHIKGAVSIPVGETFLPTGPGGMAGSPQQIEDLFGRKGIGNDNRVVVYDAGKETSASRVLWTLEYYGHKKVSVLNGGYKKWQKENKETSTAEPAVTAAKFTAKAEPARLDTLAEMRAAVGKGGIAIVDARSPEEYRGEDVRTKRGGHVPGAVNIDWRTLFTADDTFKSPAELAKMYQDKGVTKDKEVHAY